MTLEIAKAIFSEFNDFNSILKILCGGIFVSYTYRSFLRAFNSAGISDENSKHIRVMVNELKLPMNHSALQKKYSELFLQREPNNFKSEIDYRFSWGANKKFLKSIEENNITDDVLFDFGLMNKNAATANLKYLNNFQELDNVYEQYYK